MQQATGGNPQGQAGGSSSVPSAEALPTQGAQAGQRAGPPRTKPGATTTPAAPAARPPAGPPAQQRNPQGTTRPAADLAQQVQFDQNGLVTMHTNELDVRQLLELLSRRSGMNILVSPKVTGTITANFEGVTVEAVLQAIIKLANLKDKVEGKIHYIYTKDEVQDDEEFTKKERILTKVYKLSYVRADEILGVIRPFLSREVGQKRISVTPSYRFGISESATFVSGGGQAMSSGGGAGGGGGGTGGPGGSPPSGGGPTIGGFQPPTGGNSLADYDHLIIQDYESNLQIIDQIIERIDVRPIQVLIEAVIISVDYEHDRELGVNLGLVDSLGQSLGTIGTGTALNGNVGFTPTKLLTASGTIAQSATVDPQGFTSATNGAKFGFVANNVTGFIRALETIGSTKILASPRILVMNKQRAEIQLGSRLGFQTLSQNFTSTIQQVQFLNTGTLLRLRPFVSDDGMVRMEIHPERSSGSVTNNIPNQQTAELTTNVMVPDGATLVIGGLIEDEDDFGYQGLPLLSRFPALGFLTGARQKTEGRRELCVLLTPHIWSIEQSMAQATVAHGVRGAFDASDTGARSPATFDPKTGMVAAVATAPMAVRTAPGQASGGATPPPAANAGQPAMLASNETTTPAVGSAACAPGADPDPKNAAAPQRRRWSPIRDWLSRKSRGNSGDRADNSDPSTQPVMPGPGATAMPPPGGTPLPPNRPPDGPNPSPQQMTAPEEGRPNLEITPDPLPTAASTGGERFPRRDPALAQASWQPDRNDLATTRPQRADRRAPEPAATPETRGIRPDAAFAGPRRHTIDQGETFESLAHRYYGSDLYAESLRHLNKDRINGGGLRPGDQLVIPTREELDAVGGWVVQTPSRVAAGATRADPAD
jgi:type IV pilus secretin PilQ/predicted competence protein